VELSFKRPSNAKDRGSVVVGRTLGTPIQTELVELAGRWYL